MATVYNIKIKTVSPWISYTEEQVKEKIQKALKQLDTEGNRFENTEIEVIRK